MTASVGPAAVQLRMNGTSFKDIAHILGLSTPRAAITAVTRELQEQAEADGCDRDQLRAKESANLESLMMAIWEKAHNPNHEDQIPAIRAAVAIIDRRIKLNGLDAPTEVVVHTPTATELDQWVVSMVAQTMPQLEEADIIEGELIE